MSDERRAKIFNTGGSQAVRLPAEYRFEVAEVYISKEGDKVVLSPTPFPPKTWGAYLERGQRASDDFMTDYMDLPAQEREPV